MSVKSLNLGKKADFLLATGSSVSTIANLFGRNPEEWEIEEGSYNGVPFHVLTSPVSWGGALPSIRDQGGRRLAKFTFPYRDGQTTDDLGRTAESFDCEIILFGDSYVAGLKILMGQLQSPKPGLLIHPVRGVVRCKMQSYELTHSHEQRKAVAIRVTFVEHNFSLASYGKISTKKTFRSILSSALQAYSAFQSAINKIKSVQNLFNTLKNQLETLYESYDAAFTDTAVSINTIFNQNESIDFPNLLPVNKGGVFNQDGTLVGSVWPVALNPNDPFRQVPIAQIQAQVSAAQALFNSQLYSADEATLSGLTGVDGTNVGFQAYANVAIAIQSIISQNKINSTRVLAEELIQTLSATKFSATDFQPLGTDSDGSLEFYDQIMDLKRSVILLQEAYDQGSAQANIGLKSYTTPRAMSIREIAFANGIDPERSLEIDLLNPELATVNNIASGTEVFVPL
jgi:hypothetical protein